MAYDELLADRIRNVLGKYPGVTEKKMFGGLCFLLHGKMFVGIVKDDFMVRVGPEAHDAALQQPHTRPMDFTGRPMKGYICVEPAGSWNEKAIQPWVRQSLAFAATLSDAPKPRRPTKLQLS